MFRWFTWTKFLAGLGAVAGAVIATPQLGLSGGVLAAALLLQTLSSLFTTRTAGTATNAAGLQLNGLPTALPPALALPPAPRLPALPPELTAFLTAVTAALPPPPASGAAAAARVLQLVPPSYDAAPVPPPSHQPPPAQ